MGEDVGTLGSVGRWLTLGASLGQRHREDPRTLGLRAATIRGFPSGGHGDPGDFGDTGPQWRLTQEVSLGCGRTWEHQGWGGDSCPDRLL